MTGNDKYPRYQMHSLMVLLASYLPEWTPEDCERELRPAYTRHADHYRKVLSSLDDHYLQGKESIIKTLWFFDSAERTNIQRAWRWTVDNWRKKDGSLDLTVVKICADFPNGGIDILRLRLHSEELKAWISTAIQAINEIIKVSSGETLSIAKKNKGALLGNLGNTYSYLSEYRKAIEYHEQALIISREIGDRSGEGANLCNLGGEYYSLGEYLQAIEYHEQALTISKEIGDRRMEGSILGSFGNDYQSLTEYRKAIEYYEQALIISREIGDRLLEGNFLCSLGNTYYLLDEHPTDIECHDHALRISREIGSRHLEGKTLLSSGSIYDSIGKYYKAIEYYEQALIINRDIGDRRGEGLTCHNLAGTLDKTGITDGVLEYAELAVEILESIESPYAKGARERRDYLKSKLGK